MNKARIVFACALATGMGLTAIAPSTAHGQIQRELERRQQKKNEWRNLAYAAGALGVLGLLNNDKTLTFAGAAGALYSLTRYEADRKSQSKTQRLRAYYFSKPSFYRNGSKYTRKMKTIAGKRYYYFVKSR